MDPQQALSPSPANYWMVTPEMLHQYEMAQLMSQHQYVPVTAHQPIPNVQVTPVIEHWPTSNIAPTPAISKNQPLGIPPVPKQMVNILPFQIFGITKLNVIMQDQYSSHEITKWAFELDECARAEIKEKKVRPGRETIADRKCDDCGLDLKSSPAMRRGPRGPNTLCNRVSTWKELHYCQTRQRFKIST